jgi:DNA ligase-1
MKPMLSADLNKARNDFSTLHYPLLASPKFDGIRCVIYEGKALTRSLKPIPNRFVRAYLEALPDLEGMDGELMVEGSFQAVTSAIMSHEGEPSFVFNVFDNVHHKDPFHVRLGLAAEKVDRLSDPRIVAVKHEWVRDAEALEDIERDYLDHGFEGVMLRDPKGAYKSGRATLKEGGLIKVKRFFDCEAQVIGYEEKEKNTNEAFKDELGRTKRSSAKAGKVGVSMLGALRVRGLDGGPFAGAEFSVGSGLNDGLRAMWWHRREELEGMIMKFKYQPHGVKNLPRSPIFLGFRDVRDL